VKIAFAHFQTLNVPRGIERYVIEISSELIKKGHEVHIVAGKTTEQNHCYLLHPEARVHLLPHWDWRKKSVFPFYLAHFLQNKYDLVFVFFGYCEGWAVRLSQFLGGNSYAIIFQYPLAGHAHRYNEFRRFSAAMKADILVAVSEYVAQGVHECFNVWPSVIPNGVNVDHFKPESQSIPSVRAKLGVGTDDRILMTCCSLEPRKGVQHIINALPKVVAEFQNVCLIVVGDGWYKAALSSEVKRLGLSDRVMFLGNRKDVHELYSAADVFLLLSEYEAFGIVVLEAMASGTPVVVSVGSAFPEIVPEKCGLRVEPTDSSQVAHAIHSLLGDDALRLNLGNESINYVKERFTWKHVADSLVNAISEKIPADVR